MPESAITEQGVYLYINSLTQAKFTKNKVFTTIPLLVCSKTQMKIYSTVKSTRRDLLHDPCGFYIVLPITTLLWPGTSISKDWRGPTYVFIFWEPPEVISESNLRWGFCQCLLIKVGSNRLLLKYCIVCVYVCLIKRPSLLRILKITLQIYLAQDMEAIIANKPSYSGILVSVLKGRRRLL